jgi:hypothetical protein
MIEKRDPGRGEGTRPSKEANTRVHAITLQILET